MKKLTFIVALLIMGCSSSDDSNDLQNAPFEGNWIYSGGTFTGNNKTGVTDPYFIGTEFNISNIINLEYSNGASPFATFVRNGNTLLSGGTYFFDTGIKSFNGTTLYYSQREMIKDSDNNSILLEHGQATYLMTITQNAMSWVKSVDGYDITYNFVR